MATGGSGAVPAEDKAQVQASQTQEQPAPITPPGSSSTTVKTTTTAPISATIPDEFKGSSGQELVDYLEKKVREHKPLSEDDLKKIRRRQKAEGILSGISDAVQAVSNLVFATRYAPNMYNPKEGLSVRARERFDREKAEREAEDDRYFNYAMTLAKLRDADKARGLDAWKTEQTLARQDRAYDDAKAFREKEYERQDAWHKEEGDRWERQFQQGVTQFNISSANERARLGMEAQRLSQSVKQGQMTFNLGSGNGNVTLTTDRLNAQTVSRIYNTLPAGVRAQVQGEPIVQNGYIVGYKDPTTEAMLIAIGANVENSPATQNAIRQVAGLEKGIKPAGY